MNPALAAALFLFGFLGYTVNPARIDKVLQGTTEITDIAEVQNVSSDTLRIKVELEDFTMDASGRVSFHDAASVKNSIAPFVAINPEEFFLAPQSREFVRITIKLPRDSTLPEYYGMILFKSQPIPTQYQPMIRIAGEIGMPVYYDVNEIMTREASFETVYVAPDLICFTLKNIGNTHLRAAGTLWVLRNNDEVVTREEIPEFVVLPGCSRELKSPLRQQLGKGSYTARIRLDYGTVELIEAEIDFTK